MSSKAALPRIRNSVDRKTILSTPAQPARGCRPAAKTTPADEAMLDAKTAASMLGVKTQTLYAYVSRGLIRTAPQHGTQANLYHREDIEAMRMNGRGGSASADTAERFNRSSGGSVLQTAITSIDASGPRYRGKLAVDLANTRRPFEDCVELLWNGVLPSQSAIWRPPALPEEFVAFTSFLARIARRPNTRQLLALIAQAYSACTDRNAETALGAPVLAGRQLIQILAPALGLLRREPRYLVNPEPEPVASVLARSAGMPRSDEVLRALNACLVLSADHELAPSTFTARIAASAGADIFACVNSAFGIFDGPLTGFGCDEAEKTLRAARSPKAYGVLLKEFAARKEAIPGYDHPLYPDGDPRALYLLDLARDHAQTPGARLILNCIDAGIEHTESVPSLAIGLVAIAVSFDLPKESPGMIMAIGRVSGWIAHVFEQRLAGSLVRPRTKYVGPPQ